MTDLEAAYFIKSRPDGVVVIDETGNGRDAKLVQSNCLTGDGVVSAEIIGDLCGLTTDNMLGKNILVQFNIELNTDAVGSYFSKTDNIAGNNNELAAIIHTNGYFYFTFFGLGGSFNMGALADNEIHEVIYSYNNSSGDLHVMVDGSVKATVNGSLTINDLWNNLYLLIYRYGRPIGRFAGMSVNADGENIFEVFASEGEGLSVFTRAGEVFSIIGATLPNAWANRQDIYHPNTEKGYSGFLYCNTPGLAYKDNTTFEELEFNFVAPKIGNILSFSLLSDIVAARYNFNGYALIIEGNNQNVYVRRVDGDGIPTNTVTSTSNAFTNEKPYSMKVTRSEIGLFSVYLKTADEEDYSLLMTGTDNTYGSGNFFVLDADSGDKISAVKLNGIDITFNLTEDTGSYNKLYIPAKSSTKDALGFELTNPAGKWYNMSEALIDVLGDTALQTIQDSTPFASVTRNGMLIWENGELKEFGKVVSGTGEIKEVSGGTYLGASGTDTAYIQSNKTVIENGKTYKYYVEVVSKTGGNPYLSIGGQLVGIPNIGSNTGSFTATATGLAKLSKSNGVPDSDAVVSAFYVWEENTIPPFHPSEFGGAFDLRNKHQVFCITDSKKSKYILIAGQPLNDEDIQKILKCGLKDYALPDGMYFADDGNGNYIIDAYGAISIGF